MEARGSVHRDGGKKVCVWKGKKRSRRVRVGEGVLGGGPGRRKCEGREGAWIMRTLRTIRTTRRRCRSKKKQEVHRGGAGRKRHAVGEGVAG